MSQKRRRHRCDTECIWIIWLIVLFILVVAHGDDEEEITLTSPTIERPEGGMLEGVVERLMPAADGVTIVVFENGDQRELYLGDHEVYVGEWNQFRVNTEGYVGEIWLGENSIQEAAGENR